MNISQGTTAVRAIVARRRTTGGWVSPLFAAVLVTLQLWMPTLTLGLPTDGEVVAGHATIQQATPESLSIQQATDKAILNWHSFSIAANETVRFYQPSIYSIALNRVTGIDPSVILGQLQANGRIFLLNPNGILFGAGAQINVGGLFASTLQMQDTDFMAGRYLFAQDPLKGLRSVVNKGEIRVSDQGFVYLVSPGVANDGLILANLGSVLLGSAQKVTINLMGDGLINYALSDKVASQVLGPDGKSLTSAVSNSGTIQADGGYVLLSARASGDIFESVINQSGIVRAKSLVNHGGVIRLEGGDPVQNSAVLGWQQHLGEVKHADGLVLNTGTLDVSAAEAGATQGEVTLSGHMVGVTGSILAHGADNANGGNVLATSSEKTIVASDAIIDTSGVGNSSAGNAVIWSDKTTAFRGTILAKGGEISGNGGQIEVSGHDNLGFLGRVNALAPNGLAGSLLLDPRSITVATGGAATLAQVDQFSNTPGTNRTIDPATINAAAANVTLQANRDITVTNAIAMTNNGVGITMQAGRDIFVNNSISTTNGNISMTANDSTSLVAHRGSNANGNITFVAGANLSSGTGNISLTIDPATARNFAPGSITTVKNLTTTTGNISFNSPNAVSLSGAVNAGSGTVTINTNTAAGANNFTMNAGSSITTTNTTAGAVQINVNAAGGGTGTAALGNITVPAAGTLTVATNTGGNITGGAITQNVGTSLSVGTAQLSTGNGAITLNNAGNDFGTATVSRATNVTLQDSNALILGASTVSGTLGVTTAGALTQSGALVVTGTTTLAAGAANNITLNNAGNNFSTVGITSGNNVNLRDANALILGASTVSGTLGVTTAGALTQSGALAVTGVTTLAAGAVNNITLNNAANNFNTVGITSGNNVALTDTNALVLGASTVSGTLGVTTGGTLTQTGALTVAGVMTLASTVANSDILLDTQANNFTGAVSFGGVQTNLRDVGLRNINAGATVPALAGLTNLRNLTLTFDTAPVTLPALTASGNLLVTAGGAITDSGNLAITGTTTLAAGVNNITLDNADNFTGVVAVTSGNNVTLNDINALVLGASTVSGTLNAMTNGAVTQTGALTVTGVTTLAAGAANDITFNNAGNDFSTAAVTSGNNVALTDATALDLAASTISGTFNVTAGGLISQSGALTVAGNASFNTTAAPALGSVSLTNGGALTLATSTVGGNLTTTTAGDITLPLGQTLTVAGDATLTPAGNVNLLGTAQISGTQTLNGGTDPTFVLAADTNLNALALPAAGNITVNLTGTKATFAGAPLLPVAVILPNAGNNFGGTVSVTTASPAFTGTVTNTYNLTQSSAVTLNPGQGLTATDLGGTAGTRGNITLPNAGNAFNTVTFTGGDIGWQQANAVTIGSVSANTGASSTGALTITMNGPITQTGAVVAAGITTFAAGAANDITLTNAGNNFSTVGITSGNNVSLTDAAALVLGTSTVSGNLALTTGGTLSQTGSLAVAGTTSFTATAANTDILLNTQVNNFGSTLSFVGIQTNLRDVQLRNINGGAMVPVLASLTNLRNLTLTFDNAPITLPALTASGNLNITAGGSINQSGAVAVGGTTTLATTVAGSDLLLDTQANNLGSAVLFGGTLANIRDIGLRNINPGAAIPSLAGLTNLRNLTLTFDNAPIALPTLTLTAGGNLDVTAGGSITETGAITVPGATTLATTVAASDILLNTQANNFGGAMAFGGTQAYIRDVGLRNLNAGATTPALTGVTNLRNLTLTFDNAPIAIPNLTASGIFNATARGTISQTGALTIAGITTLAAGINDIALTNGANNFSTVGITSGNNVSLVDNNELGLGVSSVTGNLNVTTGGALTQSGALTVAGTTTLAVGAIDIVFTNAGNNFGVVGVASGNNVTLTDANALTITASTVSGNFSANAGDLTVGGTVASTGGALNLTAANSVTQLANLTAAGANTVTVTTAGGPITMAAAATTTSGTSGINYTAGTDVTLGSLSTGGAVNVIANGGSVLSAVGSGTNVTAGANSTLQAFNGVVGTTASSMTVNVNPGMLGVRATMAVGGISVFINGIVLPSNALTPLNVPPGLVCFNICPVTSLTVSGLATGLVGSTFGYLNPATIIPAYYPQPSRSVLISDITSVYMPDTLLQPSPVSLSSDSPAVQ